MKPNNIPNIITGVRLILIIPTFATLMMQEYGYALTFFLIAALSDGLDGYLARRYHWASTFGAIVDPIADKALMLVAYFSLAWLQQIPLWLFIVVVFRDVWLAIGVLLYKYCIEMPKLHASRISKINTALQMLLVIVILFEKTFVILPPVFITTLIYTVLITTLSSFIDYTWVWGRKAYEALH